MALSLNDVKKKKKKAPSQKSEPKVIEPNKEADTKAAESVKPWASRDQIEAHAQHDKFSLKEEEATAALKQEEDAKSAEKITAKPKDSSDLQDEDSSPFWHQPVKPYIEKIQGFSQNLPKEHPVRSWIESIKTRPHLRIPLPEIFINDDEK